MRKRIICFMYRHPALKWMLKGFHVLVGKSKFKDGKGNQIESTTANLYYATFDMRRGTDNTISIGEDTDFHNSTIVINGNHNKVVIGDKGFINGLTIMIEGNHNAVIIGDNSFIMDDCRIWVVDGSTFKMGNGCMFSDHIEIRTTDNHSIIDRNSGKRINFEEDVVLHDKVWLGHGVTLLKGSELAEGSIVGAEGVITRKHLEANTVIVGNPGKEIKNNVDWTMERIKYR